MKTPLCEMLGIEFPLIAFSHCRDVIASVSRAGGFGVLGAVAFTPEQLELELKWIDEHIDGKPYGIDVLMPMTYEETGKQKFDLERLLPREHVEFVRDMLDRAGVPRLPESEEKQLMHDIVEAHNFTPKESLEMIAVAMEHPIKLIVNALGVPPKDLVERAHARGIKVAALAGKPKHAIRHKAAGCDFVIAVGTEAAGHTGDVTSMVLWPEIVDAVAPLPVLGAGGVGRGRQIAAALALGCEGVWCGTIWLKTVQSEVLPELKQMMFAAEAQDAVLSKSYTGKQCRVLRSQFTDAWEKPGAPETLPAPLQVFLCWAHGRTRMERARAKDFMTYPVGQIVGDLAEETSVRQVVHDMLNELIESKERLDRILG